MIITFVVLLIFFGAGLGVFLIGYLKPPGTIESNAGVAMAAGVFFMVVALLAAIVTIRKMLIKRKSIKNGRHYPAKIWQHEGDYRTRVNGNPLLLLVVRFIDGEGRKRQELVETGTTNTKKYPLGTTVEIAENEGKIYLVRKSEEQSGSSELRALMDPAVEVETLCESNGSKLLNSDTPIGRLASKMGAMSAVTTTPAPLRGAAGGEMQVACPGCGNVLSMIPGSSAECSCGRRITLTDDHMIF